MSPRSSIGRFWKAPVLAGGCASVPVKALPPSTRVSLHTYFFMASLAGTQGPPVSLQPGEPAMAISRFNWSPTRDGVFERVFPVRGHIREALLHHLRRHHLRIEVLESAQSGALHPFEIELDAVLGDIAVHPVPPYAGLGAFRRILKAALQRVRAALGACQRSCKNSAQQRDSQSSFAHDLTHPFSQAGRRTRYSPIAS